MHFWGAQLNFRAAELVVRYQPSRHHGERGPKVVLRCKNCSMITYLFNSLLSLLAQPSVYPGTMPRTGTIQDIEHGTYVV